MECINGSSIAQDVKLPHSDTPLTPYASRFTFHASPAP